MSKTQWRRYYSCDGCGFGVHLFGERLEGHFCRDGGIAPVMYRVRIICPRLAVLPIGKLDNHVFDVKHDHVAGRIDTFSQFTFDCEYRDVPKLSKCVHWRELHNCVIPGSIRTLSSSRVD